MNEKQQITNETRPDTVAMDTKPDIRQNCMGKDRIEENSNGKKGRDRCHK